MAYWKVMSAMEKDKAEQGGWGMCSILNEVIRIGHSTKKTFQ